MRYKIFDNGVHVNTIYADETFVEANYPGNYEAWPEPQSMAPADPCEWLIDIGPFFDRFTDAKMPILKSTDADVKAILADVNVRKWVDLKRTDVIQAVYGLSALVPEVTVAIRNAVLNTPVTNDENRVLRKLYF